MALAAVIPACFVPPRRADTGQGAWGWLLIPNERQRHVTFHFGKRSSIDYSVLLCTDETRPPVPHCATVIPNYAVLVQIMWSATPRIKKRSTTEEVQASQCGINFVRSLSHISLCPLPILQVFNRGYIFPVKRIDKAKLEKSAKDRGRIRVTERAVELGEEGQGGGMDCSGATPQP